MTSRTHHSFDTPDRHGVQRCKLCRVLRRTVYPFAGGRVGAQVLLYRDPRESMWTDWNPGCSMRRSFGLEIVPVRGDS